MTKRDYDTDLKQNTQKGPFTFLVRQSSESDGIRVETWKMASTVEVA